MTTAMHRKIAAGAACFLSVLLSIHAQEPSPTPASQGDPRVRATPAAGSTTITTTGGINGYLPVFTGASTVVDSIVYQTPNGIGIGRTPNAMLDVNGKSIFRGGQVLSRTGDATASAAAPSFGLIMQSSVYSSSSKSNLLPYFQLQTEPTGNNTASPAATFNFLYYSGIGATPSETGLYFNPNGTIHFAPSQTFPITQGPVGPQGPAGPAGPKGATGPQGPAGPAGSLALPFNGTTDAGSGNVFTITNKSTTAGGGIAGYGGTSLSSNGIGGAGVSGIGGTGGATNAATVGGVGINGVGGSGLGSLGYGGDGGDFQGGDGPLSGGFGIYATGGSSTAINGGGTGVVGFPGPGGVYGGSFAGDVSVGGNLSKSGGSFKIDDPVDPENKYLYHSFVESPDMMNIYNGNAITDGSGTAVVTMPGYFEALNSDFRYQLTVIGQFAQAIVGSKISNGSFVIKTDKPGVEVSWQVTGIRRDAWAVAHRIPNEVEKEAENKGHFLHPELFGHAGEGNIVAGVQGLVQPPSANRTTGSSGNK